MEKPELTGLSGAPASVASEKPPRPNIAPEARRQLLRLGATAAALLLCFSLPLYQWLQFGLNSQLYSYILLIPAVSAYLVWMGKNQIAFSKPAPGVALAIGTVALSLLAVFWIAVATNRPLAPADRVSLTMLSFVLFIHAACVAFLGTAVFRSTIFPLLFLLFMAPLPLFVENAFESFLQHASADAAYGLLTVAGTPVLRDGTLFQFPGFALEVAPECSGIRSTLVLFLTSLVAGHLFLRKFWNKALLAGIIIPLGILRNAFRIFTLAQLCLHVDPKMIDSPIHHRGGPIFFALSLIPLFLLMWFLRRRERRSQSTV